MAETQMTPFVPRELRLQPKEAYLAGLQYRSVRRQYPSSGQNGYDAQNNTIEFTFSESDGISLRDTVLQFKTSYFSNASQTTTDNSASVTSAIDLVDRVEFFVGSTSVVNTTTSKSRMLAHILMKNELSNDGWFKYVGKNLVGWNSFGINSVDATNSAGVPVHAGQRVYQVPLWCLHPALQTGNLPCLGESITIRLTLAPNSVLSTRSAAASNYRLSDVELHVEKLLYEPDYKQSVMAQVAGSEGMVIPMVDYDVMQQQNNGSVDIAFTHRNQRANSLSMYIWNAKKEAQRVDNDTKFDPNLNIDIGSKVENLKVFSGDRMFVPVNGIKHPVELLGALERVAGGYAKEDTGTITFEEYTGQNGSYPTFAPIAVSLERTEIDDTDQTVVNRGLSAFDFGVDGDVQTQLKLSSALANGEELYSALVYEKALVMRDGAITVEA